MLKDDAGIVLFSGRSGMVVNEMRQIFLGGQKQEVTPRHLPPGRDLLQRQKTSVLILDVDNHFYLLLWVSIGSYTGNTDFIDIV